MEVKLQDYPTLGEFLNQQIVAVVAVPVTADGELHAATLHYWHQAQPLVFYFVTGRDSEKCRMLLDGRAVNAACVVGTNFGTPFSLQMRGKIQIVDPHAHAEAVDAYYKKRGDHERDIDDPKSVLLAFTPSWARFTDYSKGYDRTFLDLA